MQLESEAATVMALGGLGDSSDRRRQQRPASMDDGARPQRRRLLPCCCCCKGVICSLQQPPEAVKASHELNHVDEAVEIEAALAAASNSLSLSHDIPTMNHTAANNMRKVVVPV